ncbi:hypothetical protein DU53_05390 [Kosmotoga sp. DU53]|nr:hypothetical protein DU53_05390 [Kosmotoga sp. DU53]
MIENREFERAAARQKCGTSFRRLTTLRLADAVRCFAMALLSFAQALRDYVTALRNFVVAKYLLESEIGCWRLEL